MLLPTLSQLLEDKPKAILAWFEHPVTKAFFQDMNVAAIRDAQLLENASPTDSGRIGHLQGKLKLNREISEALLTLRRAIENEEELDTISEPASIFEDID